MREILLIEIIRTDSDSLTIKRDYNTFQRYRCLLILIAETLRFGGQQIPVLDDRLLRDYRLLGLKFKSQLI